MSEKAYQNYLATHPHNESRFFFPITVGPWEDEVSEYIAEGAPSLTLRDTVVSIPTADELAAHGITPESPPRVQVFELCRYLAAVHRDLVLATPTEQTASLLPGLPKLLELDVWAHPDLAAGELPSDCETFEQLAQVLASGSTHFYQPTLPPNNHWVYWPDAGRL